MPRKHPDTIEYESFARASEKERVAHLNYYIERLPVRAQIYLLASAKAILKLARKQSRQCEDRHQQMRTNSEP